MAQANVHAYINARGKKNRMCRIAIEKSPPSIQQRKKSKYKRKSNTNQQHTKMEISVASEQLA